MKFAPRFATSGGSSQSAQRWYEALVNTGETEKSECSAPIVAPPLETVHQAPTIIAQAESASSVEEEAPVVNAYSAHHTQTQVLAVVGNQALLLKENEAFYLIPLADLVLAKWQAQLAKNESQPLLIPLSIRLNETQALQWQQHQQALSAIGFQIQEKQLHSEIYLAISAVPSCLRQQNFQQLLLGLLSQQAVDFDAFFAHYAPMPTQWSLSEGIALLAEVERVQKTDNLKIAVDLLSLLPPRENG